MSVNLSVIAVGAARCFTVTLSRKKSGKTFDHVNNHRWDDAVKAVAPHVHHRVSGAHALGGERRGKEDLAPLV